MFDRRSRRLVIGVMVDAPGPLRQRILRLQRLLRTPSSAVSADRLRGARRAGGGDTVQWLKELSAAESFDGFVKAFVEEGKATALLTALNGIRGTKPVIEGDGRRATFTLKAPVEGKATLAWVKIDGLWCISDN